jgi:tryptophan synthase alpha chain
VPAFFADRPAGRVGLALFLNAGDPQLPVLDDVVGLLDARRVDCLELAVPFPNSATDGPVIRRSSARALAVGADLDSTLAFVAEVRPRLEHLRIALLADWRHTVKARPAEAFLGRVRRAGADGLLVHGLPPRARPTYYAAAADLEVPLVTTCYAGSAPEVVDEAARHAGAYVYLVARYGRSGTVPAPHPRALAPAVAAVRRRTRAPIAVGFGVAAAADLDRVRAGGADAAVVGSACVSRVEAALADGADVVGALDAFLARLGWTG